MLKKIKRNMHKNCRHIIFMELLSKLISYLYLFFKKKSYISYLPLIIHIKIWNIELN